MPSKYSFKLSSVRFPSNTQETIDRERKEIVKSFMIQSKVTQEEADKLIPQEAFEPISEVVSSIEAAISQYMRKSHWDETRKQVVAPAEVRRLAARISFKITEADDEVLFDDKEMDFLVKVFESDLPPANTFVFVGDAIMQAKAEQGASGADAKTV